MIKIALVAAAVLAGFLMGCYNPVLEPLPTYTPYPSPEARVVVVTPTPVPEEGWTCFTGEIKIIEGTGLSSSVGISIIGEQVVCAKEWKISNLYGPVGSLERNPENPLRFKDLTEMIDMFTNPVGPEMVGPQAKK